MPDLPTEPHAMTGAQAAALIAARKLGVEELARSCLARTAARDPLVKAWVHLDPDQVIAKARELDKVLIHAGAKGPLHGLPMGVKDMIDTGDMPTTNNSPIYQGHRPAQDAQVVRVMVANGAYSFGKTDTVEFAGGGRKALSRNPFDTARTPGGSSSGSGAAVGDRHVPLALGTQTAGSLIRPASFNGIYALKPTHSLVPLAGIRCLSPALDTLGWYGRSVDDLALVAQAFRLPGVGAIPQRDVAGLRIGVCRTAHWDRAAPETVAAIERAAGLLAEAGAEVRDVDLPSTFDTLAEARTTIMAFETMAQFLPDYLQNHHLLHADFRNRVENAMGVTPSAYLAAMDHAAACRPRYDALFGDDLDALLTPSAPGEAPAADPSTTVGDPIMNVVWTTLHAPCINVPGATGPNGLPVGVTLAGPRLGEAGLLAVAKAVAPLIDPEAA